MTHAHYDFIAGRRLSLISPEYSAPTQRNSLPSPTSQWQLLHGRSSYLADGALAQQQPTFQAYLNSFASHDSGWHAGQSHHVEPDSYRAADISISAPSGRARVFPVSPPNDYTEPVHPTLSHSQSNHPNILPAYKNEPSAFQCDITPSTSPASNPSVSNPSFDSSKWSDSLYTLDRSESPPHTPPSPSPPTPPQPVKVEQEDPAGCFIMELSPPQSHSSLLSQSMAPPMEVPLRATQAPEGMRGMMNAFRLNPFAIQNADGRNAPQPCIMEAGPLEEEPVMLEFQIELSEPLVPPEAQTEAPSSTSPEQSLDQSLSRTPENDDDNRGQWGTYQAGEPPFTSAQDSWDESNVYVQTSEGRFTPPQDDGPAEFTSPPITRSA
ncbi:hypothetical protein AX16_004424 [Volvariella volvacea WC 439]|nr:hypothetical protein AX16_004424 [Volvariella volvacea WC 439]